MRLLLTAAGFVIVICGGMVAQVARSVPAAQETQSRLEEFAQKKAEDLEARVRGIALGSFSLEANENITRWDLTVSDWKREGGAGPAPHIAEGVLYDCLGRLQGVKTRQLSGERSRPEFADLAASRPARAAKSFEAALRLDPRQLEARFRRAHIRATDDAGAIRELEALAADGSQPFGYLAAVSRAEVARLKNDLVGAAHWYGRALLLRPGSTAATIGLASLQPVPKVSLPGLDREDPYYTFPCTVLTPDIAAHLAMRMSKVAK